MPFGITAQGLETIYHNKNDKLILKRLEEVIKQYEIGTIAIGMPYMLDGGSSTRVEVTKQFIHKLNCKFNNIEVVQIDERLTTVAAHKTMNFLEIDKHKKRDIVDTISAVYILEMYMNKKKNKV